MSKRGEQLKGQYRYLSQDYTGQLRYDLVPNDQTLHRSRSGLTFQHEQRFLPNLTGKLDFNKVSDSRYVVDFATPVQTVSAFQQGENVRMVIEAKGQWEHNAYQSDTQFVVEVKPAAQDPSRVSQRGRYTGEKLSLNFQAVEVRADRKSVV